MKSFYISAFTILAVGNVARRGYAFMVVVAPRRYEQTTQRCSPTTTTTTTLAVEPITKRRLQTVVHGAFMGWFLATRIATAATVTEVTLTEPQHLFLDFDVSTTTTMIASGAYVPESGYASLDFSLPSYSVEDELTPKSTGLEEGNEEPARRPRPATKTVKANKATPSVGLRKGTASPDKVVVEKTMRQKDEEEQNRIAENMEKQRRALAQREANIAEVKAERQRLAEDLAAKKNVKESATM